MHQGGGTEVIQPARDEPGLSGITDMRPPAASAPGLRVLVADDFPDTCESLQILLRLWGHDVAIARDGVAALASAQAFRPHVALLDFEMPGLSGGEVARRLRETPGFEQLVIVAATGHDADEECFEPYRQLFDFHFRKPFHLGELEDLLAPHGTLAELRASSGGSGT
jgi:CheY-like chemotaxis protein